MKLFGCDLKWPLVKAVAPEFPPKPANGQLATGILPPFGTNPPARPLTVADSDLSGRVVSSDPRELWYLALPQKMTPKQVLMILRSGLGGDIWQTWQLCAVMLDTWPMFRKCIHEVRSAAANVRYIVHPFCKPGEEPSPSAKEKADVVERAMTAFRPDPFSDEKGFHGMLYDLGDSLPNGIAMVEMMWAEPQQIKATTPPPKPKKKPTQLEDEEEEPAAPSRVGMFERLPRASAWVHPRHYTFTNDGKLAVFDAIYNRLTWTMTLPNQSPDPDKFICAQYQGRSGSCLGSGEMRALAWYWSARMFGQEWMLKAAQRWGGGFLNATYKPGTPENELVLLKNFLDEASDKGWALHPEGTTLEYEPPVSMGTDNAYKNILKESDDACQILILGQTATTEGTAGKLGEDKTRDKVHRDKIEGVASFLARVLTEQFALAVLRVNYGEDVDELPTITADFTEAADPSAEATRMSTLMKAGLPMLAEEVYKILDLRMPEDGDQVIIGGQLGLMSGSQEDVSSKPPAPPGFDEDGNPLPFGKKPGEEEDDEGLEPAIAAREQLRKILAKASDDDIAELKQLVAKAKEAGGINGEAKAVQIKIKQIGARHA